MVLVVLVLLWEPQKKVVMQMVSVDTTGFDRAGHAVETMDADSKAPELLSEDIPWWNRWSMKLWVYFALTASSHIP